MSVSELAFCLLFVFRSWDYVQDGNTTVPDMDRTQAFSKGLQTWATWVDANLGATSTKVFFQGFSPSHR